jgi:DNA topoisomerase-1
MSTLVIVESPTKAKTIGKYLPAGYDVLACYGHIRDLPNSASEIPETYRKERWAKDHGINVEKDFEPLYVIPSEKKKVVSELKKALKQAEALVIATDEDREGESIGWHLTQVLKPKVPVRRMVFHEITKTAIQEALRNERAIDQGLVRAQETRRILDRLVGYSVSPVLWKKISRGLSAGRVQSVAVRILVDRERERRAFKSASYWELKARLAKGARPFEAVSVRVGDTRIATAKDFDENTGRLKANANVLLLSEQQARDFHEKLSRLPWTVSKVERKPRTVRPYPPFTTSTLQQEANRKLGLSSRDTMKVAQALYERGLITYMRTDSVHLSNEAINATRKTVEKRYGKEFVNASERRFTTKSKGAQEAHEAIRPAGDQMLTAKELSLTGVQYKLYDLVWKRTVATQMADARQELLSVHVASDEVVFRSSGKRILFPGFLRAYVEGTDDPNAALEDREVPLPDLQVGDTVDLEKLEPISRQTRPPNRYTEAALVAKLEKEGIGRPSTYATIISTILARQYARKQGNTLIPTFTAFSVTQLMQQSFQKFVDIGFTASMEQTLDGIAKSEVDWLPWLQRFWQGKEDSLHELVVRGTEQIDPRTACTLTGFDDIPARVRIGRYGPYLEVEHEDEVLKVSMPEELSPSDLTAELANQLVQQKIEGPKPVALEPETGEPVFVRTGRYGPYIQVGEGSEDVKPKRVALPKGLTPEKVTPEIALGLAGLPRTLGIHPDTNEAVVANINRNGPHIRHIRDYRSLTKNDDVLTVDFTRAMELLAQEKRTARRGGTPLRELGEHPENGGMVVLMDGRYGPYVTHDKVNATLPKGASPEALTLEEAVELIAAKIAAGPRKKRGAKRKASSKKSTRKAPAKKAKTAKRKAPAKKK